MNRELAQIYQTIIAPWGFGFNLTITPLEYTGMIAGSEYEIYNVDKAYLFISTNVGGNTSTPFATGGVVSVYDLLNVISHRFGNLSSFYDSTALTTNYSMITTEQFNYYASRIVATRYTTIKLTGYRINRV